VETQWRTDAAPQILHEEGRVILISGFSRDVDEICALLGYNMTSCGNCFSCSSWTSWHLKMGPIHCPEMSVNNYHTALLNIPEEHRSQGAVISRDRKNSLSKWVFGAASLRSWQSPIYSTNSYPLMEPNAHCHVHKSPPVFCINIVV
jgi:hypothetical protein